jgi:hypothetical protein
MWAVRDVSGVGAARLARGPDASGETVGVAASEAPADEGDATGADAAAGLVAALGVGVGPELPHAATTSTIVTTRAGTNPRLRPGRCR